MNTSSTLLCIYVVSIIAIIMFMIVQTAMGKSKIKPKQQWVMILIAIVIAPITWILGLAFYLTQKIRTSKPEPIPVKLRSVLDKDQVFYKGRFMSIDEVNRITGKKYTLEDVYGKAYVEALKKEEVKELEDDGPEVEITKGIREDDKFEIVKAFAEARRKGKLASVRHLFENDATFVVYERELIQGADAIINFWQTRYESTKARKIKFEYSVVPCMLYNGAAVSERPNGYARMLITFKITNGKITHMLLAPEYISNEFRYFGGFSSAPYTEEHFKPYLQRELEPKPLRMICHSCGELSENLSWHTFNSTDKYESSGFGGTVSICPHCHQTVEVLPTESIKSEYVIKNAEQEYIKENKPKCIQHPYLITLGFDYSTPLKDTEYLNVLDDDFLIETEETKRATSKRPFYRPCTLRRGAAIFNTIQMAHLSRFDKEKLSEIIECYKRAYEDGITEAGNNLAIIYIVYANEVEKGMALLRECAEKGCLRAITNNFKFLWERESNYEEAVRFGQTTPIRSQTVAYNIAALYLRGDHAENNPLSVDKCKAKAYLEEITTGKISREEYDDYFIEEVRELLEYVDEYNPLVVTARQYIDTVVDKCIELGKNNQVVDKCLNYALRYFKFSDEVKVGLKLADDSNGHGDTSRFFLCVNDNGRYVRVAEGNELIPYMTVDKSKYGAWDVYLFSKTRNIYPTFWHGGYNIETLLFCNSDLNSIMALRGLAKDVVLNGEKIEPKVWFDGETAYVNGFYWSEYGGLFKETMKLVFSGSRIVEYETIAKENIYTYQCGIMF